MFRCDGAGRRLWLIDFEYSALGDRCFDLANLCVNSDLDAGQVDRVVRRYFTAAPLPAMATRALAKDAAKEGAPEGALEGLVAEGRARVELLRLLSDLREGLWSFAHGVVVEEQARRARQEKEEEAAAAATITSSKDKEQEQEKDSSVLPASFYKGYGKKHLDRFRRNLQVHGGDIDAWVTTVSTTVP